MKEKLVPNKEVGDLNAEFAYRLGRLVQHIAEMGFRPVIYETRRSRERQEYLWSIGRTVFPGQAKVTWTRHSRHEEGKAADVISADGGWEHPAFFRELLRAAPWFGLVCRPVEPCHVEMAR